MPDTIGVGLLGLGTVGSAVARRLITEWELLGDRAGRIPVLRAVAVRDRGKQRGIDLRNVQLTDDAAGVVDDPSVQIVVELMGGLEVPAALMQRALLAGKHVVTANKAVMATTGPLLTQLAAEHGAGIWFEGAVGAGLPVLHVLQQTLRGDRISSLDAVINGTTNVILTRMRRDGVPLHNALLEAQRRGFAEADPNSDIDGWDATYKLVVMSWLAFGAHISPAEVDRVGIARLQPADLAYSGQLGYTVKLLAHAEQRANSLVGLSVRPTAIPRGHQLFDIDDSDNAVIIKSDLAGTVMVSGLGAGGNSTASAVVSDIIDAAQQAGPRQVPPAAVGRLAAGDQIETAGYVRVLVDEVPEAAQLVTQQLEDRGLRVVETMAKPPLDGRWPQLVLTTSAAPRSMHERALETLDSVSVVREVACAMDRIEPPQ